MRLEFLASVSEVDPTKWNQVTGTDYPFTRHEFLGALERSGATSAESGWQPNHILAFDDDQLIAIIPTYLKTHSYGEYVFDWAWADAYHRSGLEYYPKLLTAIPFTPASGPRICWAEGVSEQARVTALGAIIGGIKEYAKRIKVSSWHCLFSQPETAKLLESKGLSLRASCQFHWFNQEYADFDDFLATFASRKRKNLRKERQKVRDQGFTLTRTEGTDLSEQDWQQFYQFYRATYLKRSGHEGYLNQSFFQQIGQTMPGHIMMARAQVGDRIVAASLFFKSSSHLFGRYWGALAEFDGVHFEACYYQGIEYAIEQDLQCFDPGAQGEHKIQRGFTPTATWSNHWMAEPAFNDAVAQFVSRERPSIKAYMNDAAELLPFKREP